MIFSSKLQSITEGDQGKDLKQSVTSHPVEAPGGLLASPTLLSSAACLGKGATHKLGPLTYVLLDFILNRLDDASLFTLTELLCGF